MSDRRSRSRSSSLTQPSGAGRSINWSGGNIPSGSGSHGRSTSTPAYAMYGSTRSLPPSYGSNNKKPKLPFKLTKGGLKRAESYPTGNWPVYMDESVLKQVRENTSKFIHQRITNVEKHFGDMCQGLGHYLRRLSKLRDSGDDFCRFMTEYAEKETFNTSTRESLVSFASSLSTVQDYRDSEIQRLDNKVLGPLTEYGTECKHAKEKLKQAFATRNRELKEQKNVNKARASPEKNVSQAEKDLQKASVEATRASKQLENEMEVFERRKLEDIKKIFMDFVNVEMVFHARAMEMYTQCYQNLNSMSEDEDLEEFRSSLRPPSGRMTGSRSGSRNSLNTTGISAGKSTPTTTPAGLRRGVGETPNDTLNTTNKSSMYTDTQDDDEDDDEDEETEDDEDEDDSEEEETWSRHQAPKRK